MVQPPWQDALNPQLVQRLLRPLVCPGVIPDTLAMAIFERSRQFKQRLSLLHQFQQRWNKQSNLQVPDVPIVYAQWIAPATQSAISQNPSDPNRQGAGESMRIEGEHTTSTQIVTQQSATAEPTSPTLPLVIQAKLVNPAASTVPSPVPSVPSDSKPLQSSIMEDRELALPSVNTGIGSILQHPQLPSVTPLPRPPLLESTSTQIVTQQLATAEPTSPTLPLVIQAKLVNPAASNVTSPLSSMPSDSKPLQSSIMEDRESALPSVNTGTGSILQHPQLSSVTPSPGSPLQEQKLNSGISSLAEEKALVVKAENQAVLPTPPQQRSPVTNQLPLASVTPSPGSPLQEQKLNSGISSLAEEKALVVKAENQAVLPNSPQQRSPVTNQLPLASVTPSPGSPLQEQKLNSGISPLAEEKALVVKAENQAVLPTPPQQRSPVTNQLPLASVTPSPGSPLQEQKLNAGIYSLAEEKALVVKAENQAVLPTPPQQRSPVTNQLPLSMVTSPLTGSVPNTAIAGSAFASSRLLEELPLVRVENTAALSASQALGHRTQPLVFTRPEPTHVPSINKDLPTTASRHQSTERSPVINAQPADQKLSTPTVSSTQSPPINVNRLTHQVEQKLMRKLIVERERRGQRTWH